MNAFRTIRTRLAVSQAEIGAALGVTQGNVSFYERGQTVPPDVARKLIDFARGQGLELSFDHVYGQCDLPAVDGEKQFVDRRPGDRREPAQDGQG